MHGLKGTFAKYQQANIIKWMLGKCTKFQLIRLCYLFIWWCETTEGFIDSHFGVKVSNVFSVDMGLIILILLGAALPLFLFPL